jgi:hypothetical protein
VTSVTGRPRHARCRVATRALARCRESRPLTELHNACRLFEAFLLPWFLRNLSGNGRLGARVKHERRFATYGMECVGTYYEERCLPLCVRVTWARRSVREQMRGRIGSNRAPTWAHAFFNHCAKQTAQLNRQYIAMSGPTWVQSGSPSINCDEGNQQKKVPSPPGRRGSSRSRPSRTGRASGVTTAFRSRWLSEAVGAPRARNGAQGERDEPRTGMTSDAPAPTWAQRSVRESNARLNRQSS